MAGAEFNLTSEWRIAGTIEEVADILADAERLPDWWGDVYLDVRIVEPGDADGIGRVVAFHSKGRLPYTLRWQGRVVEADRPHGWVIEATGDLAGRGTWTLRQEGETARIRYDWQVKAERTWMRLMRPLLAPVFAANHRWAMARGHEGLEREIKRRRATAAG